MYANFVSITNCIIRRTIKIFLSNVAFSNVLLRKQFNTLRVEKTRECRKQHNLLMSVSRKYLYLSSAVVCVCNFVSELPHLSCVQNVTPRVRAEEDFIITFNEVPQLVYFFFIVTTKLWKNRSRRTKEITTFQMLENKYSACRICVQVSTLEKCPKKSGNNYQFL